MSKIAEELGLQEKGSEQGVLLMPSDLLPLRVQVSATISLETSSYLGSEVPVRVELLSRLGARCRVRDLPGIEGGVTLNFPWCSEKEGTVLLEVSGDAFKARRREESAESVVVRFLSRPVLYLARQQGRKQATDYLPLGTPLLFEPPLIEEEAFSYYKRLGRTRDHVAEHCFHRAIPLQEIADVAGMESTYFSDFFKQKVGISFRDWLQQLRLARALGLMVNNNETVTFVALEAGFPSLRAFERASHKYLRMAPAQFKRLIRPC